MQGHPGERSSKPAVAAVAGYVNQVKRPRDDHERLACRSPPRAAAGGLRATLYELPRHSCRGSGDPTRDGDGCSLEDEDAAGDHGGPLALGVALRALNDVAS